MKRKFKHWAYLTPEAMREWGHIFPDRTVPVVSMIWKTGPLGTPDNIEDYFIVQWDELIQDQKNKILIKLSEQFGASVSEIEKDIFTLGMPLRKSLTNGSGTNHPGFFL